MDAGSPLAVPSERCLPYDPDTPRFVLACNPSVSMTLAWPSACLYLAVCIGLAPLIGI